MTSVTGHVILRTSWEIEFRNSSMGFFLDNSVQRQWVTSLFGSAMGWAKKWSHPVARTNPWWYGLVWWVNLASYLKRYTPRLPVHTKPRREMHYMYNSWIIMPCSVSRIVQILRSYMMKRSLSQRLTKERKVENFQIMWSLFLWNIYPSYLRDSSPALYSFQRHLQTSVFSVLLARIAHCEFL